MDNSKRKRLSCRIMAVALAVMVSVTFIPLLGDGASAATDKTKGKATVNVPVVGDESAKDKDKDAKVQIKDIPIMEENIEDPDLNGTSKSSKPVSVSEKDLGELNEFFRDVKPYHNDSSFAVEKSKIGAANFCRINYYANATAKITGHINGGYVFAAVCVDYLDTDHMIVGPKDSGMGKTDINKTISISNLSEGYHTFYVIVSNGTQEGTLYFTVNDVLRALTDRPNYNGSFRYVYSKYFNYFPYSNMWTNTAHALVIEFSKNKGKTWSRSGYMESNMIKLYSQQGFRIPGLTPNKKYKTRIRYAEAYENSKGEYKVCLGPARGTTTIKSGKKKAPKIKSVKVKVYKVKRHKVRHPAGYYYVNGWLYWHRAWTEKFYTYKIKVIVKLKKKPKSKGVYISCAGYSKYCKGNKKKYTFKFTPYPNYRVKRPPKGLGKVKVYVGSYQSKKWGGFSPFKAKKKKIKR